MLYSRYQHYTCFIILFDGCGVTFVLSFCKLENVEEIIMCISGNVENSEAESMIKLIEEALFNDPKPNCRPLFPSQRLTNRIVKLQEGKKHLYRQEGSNPSDENSALLHYIQVCQRPDQC